MTRLGHPLLWALLSLGVSLPIFEGAEVKNLTNKHLQIIPFSDVSSIVSTLLLSGNQIRLNESDRLALVSYSGLTQLYLDNNVVRSIQAKYFAKVPRLQVLSLSGNKISRLDPEAFTGQEDLTQLDLSNNSLTIFPYQPLKTLKNLQLLNVKGNPWNCSCELLLSSSPASEDRRLALAVANATCASPQSFLGLNLNEAVVKCSLAPTTAATKTTAKTSTILKPPLTAQLNNSRSGDQPVTSSNSWKFTVSVVALGLTTAVLIICAVKGPSWYKLFHNYRHRRLHDEPAGTTVFHHTPRHQQTFTFQQEGAPQRRTQEEEEEEDEDGYFEDPYIRRED